jgi:hypothetical protein
MSTDKTYNGWTNYETWAAKLWMDNDQGSYSYWQDAAIDAWEDTEADGTFTHAENASIVLARRLQDEHEEANPLAHDSTLWSDLLSAALSEVNWDEIAKALIEDGDFEDEPEEEDEDE